MVQYLNEPKETFVPYFCASLSQLRLNCLLQWRSLRRFRTRPNRQAMVLALKATDMVMLCLNKETQILVEAKVFFCILNNLFEDK